MAQRNEWLHREVAGWYEGDYLGHHVVVRQIIREEDDGYGLAPHWVCEIDWFDADDIFYTKRDAVAGAEATILYKELEAVAS